MHILPTNFDGNPNVGLYGLATENYLLLGKDVPHKHDKELAEVTGLDIARVTVAGTGMIGVFCQWVNGQLLVPHIIFDHELAALKALGLQVTVITTNLTCLGNNILIGPKAVLLNPDFKEKEVKAIAQATALPCTQATFIDIEAVGALGVIRGELGLFHRDLPDREVKLLERTLGITITLGTINLGNPYIRSGILLGKDGYAIGDASGGPELTNADEALGFIEG